MSVQIRCFHGTTEDRATAIMKSGFFESTSDGLWLGTGIYFFENGFNHARSWAETMATKEGKKPGVLEAKLKVETIVDLSDRDHWKAVQSVYQQLCTAPDFPAQTGPEVLFADEPTYRKETWKHSVDHRVMDKYLEIVSNKLSKSGKILDAVRCPFAGGRQVYDASWFFNRSCSMIAVKNGKAIVDIHLHAA